MLSKKLAAIDKTRCVACGVCENNCPLGAVMVLYKPRTWYAFCPMGTMTQGICKLKNKE